MTRYTARVRRGFAIILNSLDSFNLDERPEGCSAEGWKDLQATKAYMQQESARETEPAPATTEEIKA